MKKRKSKDQFWFVLGTLNLLAITYPISAYLRADTGVDEFGAVVVLMGIGVLLTIIDTVSIMAAYTR